MSQSLKVSLLPGIPGTNSKRSSSEGRKKANKQTSLLNTIPPFFLVQGRPLYIILFWETLQTAERDRASVIVHQIVLFDYLCAFIRV